MKTYIYKKAFWGFHPTKPVLFLIRNIQYPDLDKTLALSKGWQEEKKQLVHVWLYTSVIFVYGHSPAMFSSTFCVLAYFLRQPHFSSEQMCCLAISPVVYRPLWITSSNGHSNEGTVIKTTKNSLTFVLQNSVRNTVQVYNWGEVH